MKCFYDFHIHTALSPCADDDMTPNNIVGMAALKGLDAIAVTDHNTAKNCRAVVEAAKRHRLTIIPGMELTTSEEIHTLCYFYSLEAAEEFSAYVDKHRLHKVNNPAIFGHQYIMDGNDNITGEEQSLLWLPTQISINEITEILYNFSGVCMPAHIDKSSNSVYSILGAFTGLDFLAAEIKDRSGVFFRAHPELKDVKAFYNSDAHSLGSISERTEFVHTQGLGIKNILDAIFGA